MSRTAINFLLDCCLFLIFICLLGVSALLQFVFPPATSASGCLLWGMGYDSWHHVQSACLALMMLAVLLHLILHWTWVCGFLTARLSRLRGRSVTSNEATRTIYGVATLAMVLMFLGTLLLLGQIQLREPARVDGKAAAQSASGNQALR